MISLLPAVFALASTAAATPLHPAAEIAAAELAFARQSVAEGLNTAFAANFADDAVGFDPLPKENARANHVGRPNPPIVLDWYPAYTLSAASGDFGLSTGPWTITDPAGERPPTHGHYISVWERQADGVWKVVIDGGSAHPQPQPPIPRLDPATMPVSQLSAPAEWAGTDARVLLQADRALSALASARDTRHAFEKVAARNLRYYRHGQLPLVGRDRALAVIPADTPRRWQPQGAGIARSGELGYTYGISFDPAAPERPAGAYLRVWQRSADGWRVILDRDLPLPP